MDSKKLKWIKDNAGDVWIMGGIRSFFAAFKKLEYVDDKFD